VKSWTKTRQRSCSNSLRCGITYQLLFRQPFISSPFSLCLGQLCLRLLGLCHGDPVSPLHLLELFLELRIPQFDQWLSLFDDLTVFDQNLCDGSIDFRMNRHLVSSLDDTGQPFCERERTLACLQGFNCRYI
jgi:hypothetical protein